ncbi:histidine kinase [Puteibacter caeruleilacunae]|nr:histidine kinase [Puteibacter caeruleilacunae]
MHPLFKGKNVTSYYILLWVLVAATHFFLMVFYYRFSYYLAFVDALIYYGVYGILGLGVGFLVTHKEQEESLPLLLTYHFISGLFISSLWLHISGFIARTIISDLWYLGIMETTFAGRMVEGMFMYSLLVLFYYMITFYQNYKEKITREVELKALIKEAELSALKSQINPHFLFNSLNSVSSLTITDPEKAQEMVVKLSRFLRYSLQHDKNKEVLLKTEIDNIILYLEIEKVRFGNKLVMEFDIPEDLEQYASLPNMILQPLFENAIKYGVYETTNQVVIKTTCFMRSEYLHVVVTNNYDEDAVKVKGEGIGLRNIKNRLSLMYGSSDYLKVKDENNVFNVELIIPQIKGHE